MSTDSARPGENDDRKTALPTRAAQTRLRVVDEDNRAVGQATPRVGLDLRIDEPRRRRWPELLSFLLIVVLPTLAAFFYLSDIASERYVGETRVAVRSTEAPIVAGMGEMLGLPGRSPISQDAQALVQYLQSRSVLDDLAQNFDLRQTFGNREVDALSRLRPDAMIEDLLEIWKKRVRATFEGSNNTVLIRVTTFSPEDTQQLSRALVSLSDDFINTLSETAREDAVEFVKEEVTRAEKRLTKARKALVAFQNREDMLDPNRTADAALSLSNSLRDRIASQRAILATQLTQLASEAPSVKATEQIIAGLEGELARIEGETLAPVSSVGDARPLSEVMREFQEVSAEVEYSQHAYESALSSYEAARIDADRRHIFLATVVAPSLPERAAFPRPLPDTLTVLAIALGLWLIGLLAVHSIRDHM